jgi:hypothetical protein
MDRLVIAISLTSAAPRAAVGFVRSYSTLPEGLLLRASGMAYVGSIIDQVEKTF